MGLSGGGNEEGYARIAAGTSEAWFGGAERGRTAASQFCRLLP